MTVLADEPPHLRTPSLRVEALVPPAPVVPSPSPEVLPLPAPRGPVSQSVIDLLVGRSADVVPIDASVGPSGHAHDADLHTALWILNAAQVVALDGVEPDRAGSLRTRTLHWYLDQAVHEQLRREVPQPEPVQLRPPSSAPPIPGLPGRGRALAALLSAIEAPLQPLVAEVLRAAQAEGGMAVPVDVPACALARTNAMWLFVRDRRLRGAAVGLLCLGPGADRPATAELVRALERCTPRLVADAAWGLALDAALAGCSVRCASGRRAPEPGRMA